MTMNKLPFTEKEQAAQMQDLTEDLIIDTLGCLISEMQTARDKYGPFQSGHEIYAVALEELDEFWDDVRADRPSAHELLQVAAVAVRGAIELRDKASPVWTRIKR
jgi:hypothetical protein